MAMAATPVYLNAQHIGSLMEEVLKDLEPDENGIGMLMLAEISKKINSLFHQLQFYTRLYDTSLNFEEIEYDDNKYDSETIIHPKVKNMTISLNIIDDEALSLRQLTLQTLTLNYTYTQQTVLLNKIYTTPLYDKEVLLLLPPPPSPPTRQTISSQSSVDGFRSPTALFDDPSPLGAEGEGADIVRPPTPLQEEHTLPVRFVPNLGATVEEIEYDSDDDGSIAVARHSSFDQTSILASELLKASITDFRLPEEQFFISPDDTSINSGEGAETSEEDVITVKA